MQGDKLKRNAMDWLMDLRIRFSIKVQKEREERQKRQKEKEKEERRLQLASRGFQRQEAPRRRRSASPQAD